MPPILAPVTNNITTAITTFIIIIFAYHLILKIFSLREAANNLKVLSEAAKNCDTEITKHDEIKLKVVNEIELLLNKTRESLDFESHYKELFGHISKLVIYAFLACILVLMGAMLGLWLTIDTAATSMTPRELSILKWVFFACIAMLGYMLWALKDLPKSKPIIVWVGFAFMLGLVIGASAIKQPSKPVAQSQTVQAQTGQVAGNQK